jgi:hypothetical protein
MATWKIRDEMVLFGLKVKNGRRWYSIDERDRRPMKIGDAVLPGFFWIPVADDENGAWSSYWMRLQPGARSFEHLHDSTELILILDGAFTDDDGTDFLPGHTVCYPAGSRHSTSSKEGCTVLVVAHTGSTIVSQPQGTHARVITGSKPMRNGSRKFFTAGLTAVAMVLASNPSFAQQVVKIGVSAPLTGAGAANGKDIENGVRLTVEEANAQHPKLDGREVRFELDSVDDQGDPRIGVQVAQKLVDDGVVAVVDYYNSGVALPTSPIFAKAGIPLIDPAATNPAITGKA